MASQNLLKIFCIHGSIITTEYLARKNEKKKKKKKPEKQ